MSRYTVAFVGTGPDPETPVWGESAAMAYRHAAGYDALEECTLVACADLVRENAEAFAEEFGFDAVYENYAEMVADHEPDFVSVCTPVPTHASIVTDLVETGRVGAIHCEKPMATTWSDAKAMAAAADEAGVQLTFNHQRRFEPPWREAKRLLDDGAIGDLRRLEMGGKNVFDYGSHLVDLSNMFNDERAPEWVLGQVDYREANVRYGAHNENQALAQWAYDNGVHCLAATGHGAELVGCHNRLVGEAGEILVQPDEGSALQLRRADDESFDAVDLPDGDALASAIRHVVASYDRGEEPELSAARALRSTEVIFGVWESARRRGRVEFPLEIDDNPLEAMVESGALAPGVE